MKHGKAKISTTNEEILRTNSRTIGIRGHREEEWQYAHERYLWWLDTKIIISSIINHANGMQMPVNCFDSKQMCATVIIIDGLLVALIFYSCLWAAHVF